MKTNLILLIQNDELRNLVFKEAYGKSKYANVAKFEKVAWAQLLNIPPDQRNQYQCKILCDSYLDYKVYNKLIGFCKWSITHSMPCQVVVQDTLETYTFDAITNRRKLTEEELKAIQTEAKLLKKTDPTVKTIKYLDKKSGKWASFTKPIHPETVLSNSAWQYVEQEISPLKRLFNINKHYAEEIRFKEEFAISLMQAPVELGLMQIPITQAWEYCKVYAPAYGLDSIYIPITRDTVPRDWLLQRPGRPKLDSIHDEKARLNRVLQTLPLEYEAQIRNQLAQIRYYQLHQIPWLPEYVACPECGHPVNALKTAELDPITGRIGDTHTPHCQYCDMEDINLLPDLPETDTYCDLSPEEYNYLKEKAKENRTKTRLSEKEAKYYRRIG